jgi:hypothetical protein
MTLASDVGRRLHVRTEWIDHGAVILELAAIVVVGGEPVVEIFQRMETAGDRAKLGFRLLEVQKACRLLAAYPNGCCHWGRTQKPQSRPGSYDGDGRITRSVNFSGDWLGRFEIVLVTDVVSPDNQFM